MYIIHTIWRIWCVDRDEQWSTDISGWKGWMDVGRNCDGRQQMVMLMLMKLRRMAMDDNYDEWQLWRTMTATNWDNNGQQLQLQWRCTTIRVYELCSDGLQKRIFLIFFYYVLFFIFIFIFFFISSTNPATCSFDHSCRELAGMEIENWSLKKWRKPNIY
jgi:hypothetical protein